LATSSSCRCSRKLLQSSKMDEKVTALVFAAGLGTRLYPLTADRPKALVCYEGKPLLQHVLDKLVAAGVRRIVVNVHHFADQIVGYLRTHPVEAEVLVSDERAYLRDTAGGLKFAEPLLGDCQQVLLYNVDILSSLSIEEMLRRHRRSGAMATLAVRDRTTQRYLIFSKDTMRLCGWKNVKTGEWIGTFDADRSVSLAFSGIHVVQREFLELIPSVEKQSLTPFYLQLADKIPIVGFQHQDDEWMDVGKYKEFCNVLS